MAVEKYADSEIDPVFRRLCGLWMTKIQHARQHKEKVFQKAADECQEFYNGPSDWKALMGGAGFNQDDVLPMPTFQVSINKTFEFVSLFAPALYYENPVRTAKPMAPLIPPPQFFPDPNTYMAVAQQENSRVMVDGLRGMVIESVLNYTSNDSDLAGETRLAIDEALIKGRGCLWTELHKSPGSDFRTVQSTWESTDDLLIDPDARSLKKAKWIARKCIHPVWQVERDLGLRRGSLRGQVESHDAEANIESSDDAKFDRKRGLTSDLVVYYKIFSKMGVGGRLQGFDRALAPALEIFGDFCYFLVAEGVPFPLNLPPDAMAQSSQDAFARMAWPTPFWEGGNGWPVSVLDFHPIPNSPWPLPHLKAGMGELRFLNWCMSFLMGKIRTNSRDFIAVRKSAAEELKQTLLSGTDFELIELEAEHGTISEVVQFLQHPEVNGDIWKMIAAVEANFDKRVGLNELMYGGGGETQIRSATEVQERTQNQNVRPDDMAKQVEAWQANVANREAMCARWHLHSQDVVPIIGQTGGMAWDNFVATTSLQEAAHQLEYRIEAGSTRRPNRSAEIQQISQGFTTLSPILQGYAQQTGDMGPLNNLIESYAKALDLDPAKLQLQAMPPPPPPPSGEPGSAEEEQTSQPPPGQ